MFDSTPSAPSLGFINPFLYPTIEAAACQVEHHPLLKAKVAARRSSDIRSFQKHTGLSPTAPFSPDVVRKTMKATNAKKAGVSRGRWRNICASARWALVRLGLQKQYLPTNSGPLAPDWQLLYDSIKKHLKFAAALSRPIRFFSTNGINPADVTAQHFADYYEALLASAHKEPKERYRTACKYWNMVQDEFEGWPNTKIAIPSFSDTYSLPLSATPALERELKDYFALRFAKEHGGRTRRTQPPAQKKGEVLSSTAAERVRLHVCQLAAGLVHRGWNPETITLAEITDPETLENVALGYHVERVRARWIAKNPGQEPQEDDLWRNGQLHSFVCTTIQISKRYLNADKKKLDELRNLRLHTDPGSNGGEHIIEDLAPFMDDGHVSLFYREPDRIIAEAEAVLEPTWKVAQTVMFALWWRFETRFPLRISDSLKLRLGHEITWFGPLESAMFQLQLKATAKGGKPIHEPIPESVAKFLRLWIDKYRPMLCNGTSEYLFPGERPDKPPSSTSFGEGLQAFMKERIGFSINPHAYRHLATYMYLKDRPDDHRGASTLLGHTNVKTTIEYYDVLSKLEVFKRFDRVLLKIEGGPVK